MADWTPKKRAALIKRLTPWCYSPGVGGDPCTMIKLHQTNEHGDRVRGVTHFGYPTPWPIDVETLATQIINFIQEDADQQGGFCSYVLTPAYGSGFVVGDESAKITTNGQKEEDRDISAAPSEGPTPVGRQAQDMRHTETLARLYTDKIEKVMDRLFAENVSLRTRSEADDARRLNFFKQMEEVATKAWQIKKEERAEEFMRENIRDVKDMLKPIVPRLVNTVAKQPLLPEPDMQEVMLEQFFSDMQCTCEEKPNDPCEWHNLLASAAPKRRLMLNAMAEQWFTIKEKRAGKYQGDRALPSNATADAIVDEKKH